MLELLVVITIIGILAAVLFPQLTKAQEAGRTTQCKANLRNLYQAYLNYAVVNNNSGPAANPYQPDSGVDGPSRYTSREGWVTWVRNAGPSSPAASLWPSSSPQDGSVTNPTCYGVNANYSIQHGTLWEYTDKSLKSYVCPKFAQKAICGRTDAVRSYAMNTNVSERSPMTIATEASRTMMFTELQPWTKDPRWSSSPKVCAKGADGSDLEGNNGVLTPGTFVAGSSMEMTAESIGFLHQMGGVYGGHVVFCDGHVDAVGMKWNALVQQDSSGALTNRTYDACNGLY